MNYRYIIYILTGTLLLAACSLEPDDSSDTAAPTQTADRLLVLCEGLWGADNSCIALIDHGTLTNKWFQQHNPGQHLGDTGNDMLLVNDTLIAVSVNWSNIIQYIRPDGTAITATEDLPNNRCLATDGVRYLYCTSYASGGYVAKIDLITKRIVATCSVGREPEGIAYYDGRLYVCNTGGYANQTGTAYEKTVSVVDAQTMRELKRIDTGCTNLYGHTAVQGQFMCINAAGDNDKVKGRSLVLNMANDEFQVFDFPATYACGYANRFYTVGTQYSYATDEYEYSIHTITLPSLQATEGLAGYDGAQAVIEQMQTPYGLYISPYSGHLYATDARGNVTNGYVYEFGTDGTQLNRHLIRGLNPSRMMVLP